MEPGVNLMGQFHANGRYGGQLLRRCSQDALVTAQSFEEQRFSFGPYADEVIEGRGQGG